MASQARAVEAALRLAPRLDAATLALHRDLHRSVREAVASGAFCGARYLTPAEVHALGLPSPAEVAELHAAESRFVEHPAFTRTLTRA